VQAAPRVRAVAVKASAASLMHLPQGARDKFERLTSEDSDVMLLDNIVDGFYISPKFLDKVSAWTGAQMG